VRSVWSMKPPRLVTVERSLTLDLPPFQEVIGVARRSELKVADPPELEAADPAQVGAAETAPRSATGGGDGGAALDLLEGVAARDPRVANLAAVVRRDPSRWDAFYRLGHVMQSRGDLAAAERLYRHAVSLNPRHAALAYDLGYARQRQGDLQGAIEQYRAAIALKSDHVYALYNLGALLRRQGAYAEAADLLERAGSLQRDNPDLYYEWARTLEARGQPDQAIDLYRQAAALSPDRWPGPEARARMQTLLSEGPATVGSRS
jgi:tetratricopeptide (TPR) repeat protein